MDLSLETLGAVYTNAGLVEGCNVGLQYLYNQLVRRRLPPRSRPVVARYNDVFAIRPARRFDGLVPFAGDRPYYEYALVEAIETYVQRGDDVALVGGGTGVSTVTAARQVGPSGSVTVFEGAATEAEKVRETVRVNDVASRVTVIHAVVSDVENLRDEPGDAAARSPADLPACDALVLDCEGAEAEIIPALRRRPDRLIVETHGGLGAPPDAVARDLRDAGYDLPESMPAHTFPHTRGQFVLVGKAAAEDERAQSRQRRSAALDS